MIPNVAAFEINSKCGVLPFITHPRATTPSTFLIYLEIVTGISNIPGTFIILTILKLSNSSKALFKSFVDISL